ncbi:class I SAM-dependent methyltransferase [Candidatus Sumerlaeota bacterium]|nr:class I SAM-dependent methyltransferase [Candidatus Sumerlaeota bacterium]
MRRRVGRECWCGAGSARLVADVRVPDGASFPLVQCEQCKVYALHPAPSDAVLARYYLNEYYGKSRRKFVGPIAKAVDVFQGGRAHWVDGHLRQWHRGSFKRGRQPRLLDVGCGNGGFLMQMRDRGYDVEGTEWTAESARRIPSGARVPIHVGDLLTLDLPEHSFDAITLWHVFEHLRKPDETLEKIYRLLKPGGLLFLAMPNHESWQATRFGTNWFHLDPPRHLHGFGVKSLLVLLTIKRLQWLRVSTFSLEQNPYGFLQSLLNSLGYPRDRAYSVLKGTSRDALGTKLKDLSLVALLAPFAILHSLVEWLAGSGATMTVVAQKRGRD